MTPPTVPFPRPLEVGTPAGQDIIGVKRALSRAGYWPWVQPFSPYYTLAFSAGVKKFQKAKGLAADGVYGKATHERLRATRRDNVPTEWAFDTVAIHLMREAFLLQHPGIVCPVKVGMRPNYLHPTGGIPGNWALDWMDPGGTSVYAPVGCTITSLSGHDPATGTHGAIGDVFGWSIHFRDGDGFTYFATHMGSRNVVDGQRVKVGQKLGAIGWWPRDPGRSHLHLGVDAGSTAKSKAQILKISAAPRP